MSPLPRFTLWLSTLAMEASWPGAWASFLCAAVLGRSLSVAQACLCSLLASLLSQLLSRTRLRGIQISALHAESRLPCSVRPPTSS